MRQGQTYVLVGDKEDDSVRRRQTEKLVPSFHRRVVIVFRCPEIGQTVAR